MIGYASDETAECMPMTHLFASRMCERLRECMVKGIISWLGPDAKTQVTIEYKEENKVITPVRVHTVLISAQHNEETSMEEINAELTEKVIKHVIPANMLDS